MAVLADACSAIRGVTFPASACRQEAGEGLVACVTTSAIQETVDWSKRRFVPRHRLNRSWTPLQAGDILVSTANSLALVGKSARVSAVDGECAFGAFVTVLRPLPNASSRYLSYFLRSAEARQAMFALSSQTTNISNLRVSDLLSLELPLPPIPEQRRIADRLDKAMAEIKAASLAAERQFEDCTWLRFALIDKVLGGRAVATDDPADQRGDRWISLSQIARLESGHTPSRRHPKWWGGDVPWIALPDIRALDGITAQATSETTNELGLANSSARLLPTGTVVLSRTASVGFVTVMGKPMATSQDFVNWVPGPRLRSWYLAYVLMGAREYLRGLSSGAVHKTIYMPTLKSLHIRLPSVDDQDRMIERIQSAHALTDKTLTSIDQQSAALHALPATLFSAAFRGEL